MQKYSYRVERITQFPWRYNYWWINRPASQDKEITNGSLNTNEKGEFEISFKAVPDETVLPSLNPIFIYKVYADVTDIDGETHSSEKEIRVGYRTLLIKTDIPDKLDKNAINIFKISTQNIEGNFVPASGNIHVEKLKSPAKIFRDRKWQVPDKYSMSKDEFYKDFPEDIYSNENNPSTWPVEAVVLNKNFNTGLNKKLKLPDLENWEDGMYKLTIQSKDKFGEKITETFYFTLYNPKSKNLPYTMADWSELSKTSGEPGENIEIAIGSACSNAHVLYELESDKKIVETKWFDLNNEQNILSIRLKEEYRGNIGVHWCFINNNRLYNHDQTIQVPYTNKMLDIGFETFRDKLQPGENEQWKIKIKGKNGDKVAAEMVATLYDASLDAIVPNKFDFSCYGYYYPYLQWNSTKCFDNLNLEQYTKLYTPQYNIFHNNYSSLSWFGFGYHSYPNVVYGQAKGQKMAIQQQFESPVVANVVSGEIPDEVNNSEAIGRLPGISSTKNKNTQTNNIDLSNIKSRTNLNETAFFYPQLQTDQNGELLINFTIPEALTRWKMLGFAHTTDLKYGFIEKELETQKELMVTPNAPRFLREGDTMTFTAKINSLSANDLKGTAQLMLYDALTMKSIDVQMQNNLAQQTFEVKKGESVNLNWDIIIPSGLQAVDYKVVAKTKQFSDGEEAVLPVLTNSMLVTETMPLPVKGKQTKIFTLDKLLHNTSTTLRSHKLTLEYTPNPAWYAIQALPYLMEYPNECAEQTFSRFYANSLASFIANSNPKIKQVFDSWKNITPDALLSNLEKNQELKDLLLDETPWVMDGKDETERKQRLAVLFDLNHMSDETDRAFDKLQKLQTPGGAWPWFAGMPEDRYITQHIVCGMGKLDRLGVKYIRSDSKTWNMVLKAVGYTDNQIVNDYNELKRLEKKGTLKLVDNHLDYSQIHYLYARSFFKDVPIGSQTREAFDYYLGQARQYWLSNGFYMEGMLALALNRYDDKVTPAKILKSLKEYSSSSEELGMYWKKENGWFWYQAPIETQAMMIEAFDEVANDTSDVNEMKVWLLKQKQTQDWKTTRATVEACYALLLRGTDWLSENDNVDIKVGDIDISQMPDLNKEAGTGYFKTSWNDSDIKPEMGSVTVSRKGEGISWGALYWQYFEQLDKITSAETPLKLKKQLFVEHNTNAGQVIQLISDTTSLKPGDLIKVRIELRVDRAMEYVHMKDMRAAGLEPLNVLSGYKYQDGLGYYESTRDAATNFFFGWLAKGTYVFEYPLRLTHYGNFSNGITTIQCMYAPEFTSHSEGKRILIKR